MPARPLFPDSGSGTESEDDGAASWDDPDAAAAEDLPRSRSLPLADRCWDLFCAGHSYSAIGRTLDVDRETVARYVRAIHQQVQADRRADRALALSRALAAQEQIQTTAWELLTLARANLAAPGACPGSEEPGSAAADSPLPAGEGSGVRSASATFADCARLLNLLLASTRKTARLELLYDHDAPARQADQEPQDKTVRIIIERVGDPYVPPTPPPASSPSPPSAHEPTADPARSTEESGVRSAQLSDDASSSGPASSDRHASPSELPAGFNPANSPKDSATPASPSPPAGKEVGGEEPQLPTPGWISLGDSSQVRGVRTPPAATSAGAGMQPRRLRFGLPVANAYSLG